MSWAVAARHSPRPASRLRAAAADAPVPGLLNARNVVVPPNAAATESWKKRSGSASLATRVWVWTSTTPGRTSSPSASTTSRADSANAPRSGSIAGDPPGLDGDVGPPRALGGDHRPAKHEEVGHPGSLISMGWAPSHNARRPTSRRRSSQPSSGRIVAKWLAASWPTFELVVQAPYGKKISHSLMPPG